MGHVNGMITSIPESTAPQRLRSQNGPVIAAVRALMPDSLEVLFVDDWMAYRENLGNVGTGTNVKRTAPRTCWNDGGHLFAAA